MHRPFDAQDTNDMTEYYHVGNIDLMSFHARPVGDEVEK